MVRNKSEIPWDSLPNTFRDAIEVTRQLGVRYLWIDSLCIIQDDENDWKQESSKMVEVYQNAYLTICATGGQNDDAGLWPRVVPKLIEEVMINHEGKEYKVYFKDAEDNWASHLNWWTDYGYEDNRVREISPLITRGWALQERILSSRLLHYGHGELLWQCRESTTFLAGPHPMGEVLSGSVVLRGPVQVARFTQVNKGWCFVTANSKVFQCYADSITDFENGLIKDDAAVLCLRLREDDIYQRVGMVELKAEDASQYLFSEGSHEREVEIH
ncbi:hypothetical protein E8E14_004758 [Neopestalotiopsis sp. 37M]|nr:hypothetical protein E8E14_004758 [Neopestalotiopsis sp. 37M]